MTACPHVSSPQHVRTIWLITFIASSRLEQLRSYYDLILLHPMGEHLLGQLDPHLTSPVQSGRVESSNEGRYVFKGSWKNLSSMVSTSRATDEHVHDSVKFDESSKLHLAHVSRRTVISRCMTAGLKFRRDGSWHNAGIVMSPEMVGRTLTSLSYIAGGRGLVWVGEVVVTYLGGSVEPRIIHVARTFLDVRTSLPREAYVTLETYYLRGGKIVGTRWQTTRTKICGGTYFRKFRQVISTSEIVFVDTKTENEKHMASQLEQVRGSRRSGNHTTRVLGWADHYTH